MYRGRCSLRSSRRSSVQPICVLRLWNRDSAVLKAANQRNIDIFQQVRQFFALPFDPAEALEQRASVKLADRIYLETAEKFAWPDIEQADLSDEVFCYGLRDQFGVLADGTVVPCCLDSDGNIPLGSVHIQPLTEILFSPRAKALYEGFSCRRPPRPSAAAAATPSATPDSKAPIRSPFSPAGGGRTWKASSVTGTLSKNHSAVKPIQTCPIRLSGWFV